MIYAGLIYDSSQHYVDHLAPFCALIGWPLILCEPELAILARTHYPDLEVIEVPLRELKLPPVTITCDNRPLLQASFPGQQTKVLWLPHGNSDKGMTGPFFEAIEPGEIAFVYGQRMADFIHAKQVFPNLLRVGNFRREYYLKHRAFYQNLPFLPTQGKNYLYAPTWDDSEGSSSFWEAFPYLANALPAEINLLIKLHPNTWKKFEVEIEILQGRFQQKKNLFFLPDYPPIYPLLAQCDAYIGDRSSIGYDFLTFDKPLFFLPSPLKLPLHSCGKTLNLKALDFQDTSSLQRKNTYIQTFDPPPNWTHLKENIDALCRL